MDTSTATVQAFAVWMIFIAPEWVVRFASIRFNYAIEINEESNGNELRVNSEMVK